MAVPLCLPRNSRHARRPPLSCQHDPPPFGPSRQVSGLPWLLLCGDPRELRDDLAPVGLEGLLLAAAHEVDVELVDADRLELAQLRGRGLDVAEDAEAADELVGDELAGLRPHARVL